MNTRIQQLPIELIRQIAAGEIIDRPAAVVKELIENSLDAGATKLNIEIENGGIDFIRVCDNGTGIHPDDIKLALLHHTTSKLSNFDNLTNITSLGFRGEALPSIASVSRCTLSSRFINQPYGWCFTGDINVLTPTAQPLGTTVEVRDLFFKTPARKKFLRSARIEFMHVANIIRRFALCWMHVGFSLWDHHRLLIKLEPALEHNNIMARITSLVSKSFSTTSLYFEKKLADFQISGWLGIPSTSSKIETQYFFVNKRPIYNHSIAYAVRQAYRDIIYKHYYPGLLLFLQLDPALVDVNTHPAKKEIRLREQTVICKQISIIIKEVLAPLRVETKSLPALRWLKPQMVQSDIKEIRTPPLGYTIGQLRNRYILAENVTGLVIIDIHAAHERIFYEKFKQVADKLHKQLLLIPVTLRVSSREVELLEDYNNLFAQVGLLIEIIGPETIIIRQIPELLTGISDIAGLIKDMLTDLSKQELTDLPDVIILKFLSRLACHSAARATWQLNKTEVDALLRDMESTQNSNYCNHGRPTWIQVSLTELDLLFKHGQ